MEEVEIEYDGKAITIGFNARYMIDALRVLGSDGEIDIELKDELCSTIDPGVLSR